MATGYRRCRVAAGAPGPGQPRSSALCVTLSRALAVVTMAVAAAGGGLPITAASAVRACASTSGIAAHRARRRSCLLRRGWRWSGAAPPGGRPGPGPAVSVPFQCRFSGPA